MCTHSNENELYLSDEQMKHILSIAMATEEKTKEGLYYRYEGATPQRSFCREMIRLNKLYTKDEINQMSFSGVNNEFGHNGQNYSIFNYRGGVNCKHYWMRVVLQKVNGELKEFSVGAVNTDPIGHYGK